MTRTSRFEVLAPFTVRSFRFQWPADLLTSWGLEMENLILGWYILTATGSVLLLTVFGALQYAGTLIAPLFGLAGDRLGHRNVLCAMRVVYAAMAATMTTLAALHVLTPAAAFAIATVTGLIRPSDLAMRNALVAETIPANRLMAAMGVARTTVDSARVFGSLAGAAAFALLGMAPAYGAITLFYASGFLLTLGVGAPRPSHALARVSFWRDLREGLAYVWDSPASLAAMWLAFLVNVTAFPLTLGLLPYVAREIYHVGQTGLGWLVASFAFGALTGSIAIGVAGPHIRPARMMLINAAWWYVMLLAFIHLPGIAAGRFALVLAGFAQSLSMVPMAVMLLHGAGAKFRGRIMGVRMLAIYGLPLGLMAAGGLIERFGFATVASCYCLTGLALTLAIALRWRSALWPPDAPANAR
ncbi:MFS transporter [Rhodopila globiformis]|uniref:Arabinose ABC transporter permease n=1 Tax=Rhodopila globiformis TaxID=1071 RepID=A0A2S6NPA5_RHOGL|nr:MFS transporter [Rhodopila globiformis]PPQ40804.1 arabinose ABC transporter permease [Rhodopila globiformis]